MFATLDWAALEGLCDQSLPPISQIRDIGSGNFGVAKLMRDNTTNELVAVKFIERGEKVRLDWPPERWNTADERHD